MGAPALHKVSTEVPSWEGQGVSPYCSQVAFTDIKEVGVARLPLYLVFSDTTLGSWGALL